VGTLETVVVQYGEGSWPEVDSDLFSAEQQWYTGFWSSQISSVPADWSLQSECGVWPSVSHACIGRGTPSDPSSVSDPLPLIDRWGPIPEEGWSPAWPLSPPVCCQGCQHVQESTGHGLGARPSAQGYSLSSWLHAKSLLKAGVTWKRITVSSEPLASFDLTYTVSPKNMWLHFLQ